VVDLPRLTPGAQYCTGIAKQRCTTWTASTRSRTSSRANGMTYGRSGSMARTPGDWSRGSVTSRARPGRQTASGSHSTSFAGPRITRRGFTSCARTAPKSSEYPRPRMPSLRTGRPTVSDRLQRRGQLYERKGHLQHRPDGDNPTKLTSSPAHHGFFDPAFSPNGDLIAFNDFLRDDKRRSGGRACHGTRGRWCRGDPRRRGLQLARPELAAPVSVS